MSKMPFFDIAFLGHNSLSAGKALTLAGSAFPDCGNFNHFF